MSGYTPNKWVDREGTTRYFETVDDDGALIFTPDYTQVTEMGTPVNEDNMNHIEEGIAAVSFSKYDSMTTYAKDDLVTAIVDNELKVYKSLQDNNNGNPLTDANYWEEVEIAGGGGGTLQMFDTVLKDHILTYEESKGLALQGTYVYKEAVAGSRYGYPAFYAKCLEEKEASTTTEVTLGDNTVTMYVNSNGHQFYDIADIEAVNTWFTTYGTAWFYGVDTENERIFLPRNNYFEQATADGSEVGKFVEAGLPNVTGLIGNQLRGGSGLTLSSGALKFELNNNYHYAATYERNGGSVEGTLSLDASLSNPIYGNSDTVQVNAVKKLLYICVGNTETTSTVTDVIEVTTTENDTLPLFTGMYFDFTPNNVSWLKAGQQHNNEGIYTFAYSELVNVLNGETKYGDLKVINESDMVSGVDYSEYWKVNQTNMTFTTPTAISNKALSGAVVGNGMTLGLTNGSENGGLAVNTAGNPVLVSRIGLESVSASSTIPSSDPYLVGSLGVTTDPTNSGIIAEQSTAQLYFKVANAVQNLELLNAGEVLEGLTYKADVDLSNCTRPYIIESYVNGASGYNKYSNGYYEEWGIITGVGSANGVTVTFLNPFKDTNYNVIATVRDGSTSYATETVRENNAKKTVSSTNFITTYVAEGGGRGYAAYSFNWQVRGYIA